MVEEGDLANKAIVPLRIVDSLDGIVNVEASLQETKLLAESYLAEDIESKEMKPCAQVANLIGVAGEVVQFRHQQLYGVLDEGSQLLHGVHGVWMSSHPLLLCVYILSDFGEDVRVLWWREDSIEISLVEAFASGEDFFCGKGIGEGQLVWRDAYDRAVLAVDGNVVEFRVAGRDRPYLP